jgi:hypothetical protein
LLQVVLSIQPAGLLAEDIGLALAELEVAQRLNHCRLAAKKTFRRSGRVILRKSEFNGVGGDRLVKRPGRRIAVVFGRLSNDQTCRESYSKQGGEC